MKIYKGIRINNTIWDLTNTIVGTQRYFTYDEAMEIANNLGKRLPTKDDVKNLFELEMDARHDEGLNYGAKFYINKDLDENMSSSRNLLVRDRYDQPLFLFENQFAMRWFHDKYPDIELTALL